MTLQPEEIWELYQSGIDFKLGIGLYETVARNERFFAGDQWAGVSAPDLPKPVVNFLKRACQQRIAEVCADPVRVYFSPVEFPGPARPGAEPAAITDTQALVINDVFAAEWDRLGMDTICLDGVQDACISGDCILYDYWDDAAPTGQAARGALRAEGVDNVNFYPGNPNECDIQKQPFVLLARREQTGEVRREAKRNGRPDDEIGLIAADGETCYQSGDLAGRELRGGEGKCVTLLYLKRDEATGHIFAQKTTREATVRPAWDTRLTRYPLAMMNWEKRKNCCHGRAEITGLVPVQRYVNQMYAMAMLFTMQSACPKPIFNQGMIRAWSNAVGAAIAVNGDINAAAKYLEPPSLPEDAYSLPERLMDRTMEMLGVTGVDLGTVNPVNNSAMTLARKISSIPIGTIRSRYYAMVEDFARNWLDMVTACQTVPRWQLVSGGKKAVVFDAAALREKLWAVKVDVGARAPFGDTSTAQTLGALYEAKVLTPRQYVERLPEGCLPMREKLLAELGDTPGSGKQANQMKGEMSDE